jgi:hypothetical protein
MKYLMTASPSDRTGLANLLEDAQASSELPEGVRQINDRTWLVDERKGLRFYAALVHNAPSRNVELAVFRLDEGARLM